MPQLRPSHDHSIWFKHIDDANGELLPRLRLLEPGQAVVLQLGDSQGEWRRYASELNSERSTGLKPSDPRSKHIWRILPVGEPIEISFVAARGMDDEARRLGKPRPKKNSPRKKASNQKSKERPKFTSVGNALTGSVLCIGIDVAWWGGKTGNGADNVNSRSECLAYASKTSRRWGDLSIERVDLNVSYNDQADTYTPNADPNAATLLNAINGILQRNTSARQVIIALDAPLLARDRPALDPPRKVIPDGANGDPYRDCDTAWNEQKKRSPDGWRNIPMLPGGNPAPRLKALVAGLRNLGFVCFSSPSGHVPAKVAIECFPNEIIWSAGVLGYAPNFTSASLLAYKRLGKTNIRLPSKIFDQVWRHTLTPALKAASLNEEPLNRWLRTVAECLRQDGVVTNNPAEGAFGKKFDDTIDSLLSLAAAVGCANGVAHVHQGAAEDGHIIGPGLCVAPASDS